MKRMLEIKVENGRAIVHINSSSLSVLQECRRKAHYMFNEALMSKSTPAMDFGTRTHKGLADWYTVPASMRDPGLLPSLMTEAFKGHEEGEDPKARTLETALKIARVYEEKFQQDPWTVVSDGQGPMVEREMSAPLVIARDFEIHWFGTADLVVQHAETGQIAVMDHKTSKSLGEAFVRRYDVSHQLTGYVFALRYALGQPVSTSIVNGLQVAKTKQEVVRIEAHRGAEHIDEFRETVIAEVLSWLDQGHDLHTAGTLPPMSSAWTCSGMGQCQFLEICSASKQVRPLLIDSKKRDLEERALPPIEMEF